MSKLSILFTLTLALAFAVSVQAQSEFSSLEERMTAQEFSEAGLDKLSDEELAELNAWIRANVSGTGASEEEMRQRIRQEVEADTAGSPPEDELENRGEFTAIVPGHFTGWTGNTVFELDNGEVWKQVSGGSYRVSMDDPTVVVYPVSFGGWRLRLEEQGPSIGVKRMKPSD